MVYAIDQLSTIECVLSVFGAIFKGNIKVKLESVCLKL